MAPGTFLVVLGELLNLSDCVLEVVALSQDGQDHFEKLPELEVGHLLAHHLTPFCTG